MASEHIKADQVGFLSKLLPTVALFSDEGPYEKNPTPGAPENWSLKTKASSRNWSLVTSRNKKGWFQHDEFMAGVNCSIVFVNGHLHCLSPRTWKAEFLR